MMYEHPREAAKIASELSLEKLPIARYSPWRACFRYWCASKEASCDFVVTASRCADVAAKVCATKSNCVASWNSLIAQQKSVSDLRY